MYWITQLAVALWATANNYAWYVDDPVAKFALVQAGYWFPTPGCVEQAKVIAVQVITDQTEFYWCSVNKEAARAERDQQAKEDHDQFIKQQLAKGDKWDRWEVSPPTVINNFISPTMINPTFIAACTPPPHVPGLDVKALALKNRPTTDSDLIINHRSLETAIWKVWIQQAIVFCLFAYGFWKVVCWVSALVWWILRQLFFGFLPSPPCPSKSSSPPLPKKPSPPRSPVTDSPLPTSGLAQTGPIATAESPASSSPVVQEDGVPHDYKQMPPGVIVLRLTLAVVEEDLIAVFKNPRLIIAELTLLVAPLRRRRLAVQKPAKLEAPMAQGSSAKLASKEDE